MFWYYIVRQKSKSYLLHGAVPVLGFAIIAYVLFNADALAKIGGLVWLVIGAIVLGINVVRGRGVPELATEQEVATLGEGSVGATDPTRRET
jgi:hypothetical protein